MEKKRLIGFLTIIAGLPGLGGFWLLGQLSDFPPNATIIVINAIFFRGICGVLGGALIWRGSKWGYYLTLVTWMYLIVVSILTLTQLYSNGIELSYNFLQDNYSSFGRPFLFSILKILFAVPIVHIVLKELLLLYKSNNSD